ncbi:rodlin [Streptomyces sp. NPDC060334]|uniref:rodlin n=1 Tax=unclassified Streptomyces TaxID=2593676 RepID=UPI0006B00ED8|nr:MULTISPECIES: rodlin [unclassified Streptomyces]KOU52272.1 RdlA protein [Streptomyces sp. WM4235]MCX5074921.1 rodlin [Streptomyces sp. NBC_00424]MCX5153461.1 rodlin [Streptomyces sp. NBC_00291]WUD45909.1 rodlin [Streptomyces sp. NBC_00513]
MLKKIMTAAAVSAVAIGAGAAAAAPAMAIGNDNGVNTVNGNGASQIYGNQKTSGDLSPQLGLVQGTLNKPCIGLPAKVNAQSLIALLNIGVQDINVLSNPQNQQCTENSTQAKGDEPLSHILDNIPVLSGNASLGS